MTNICNDNILYYYILNSKKIIMATEIISIALVLIMLLLFIIRFNNHRKNHTLKKDFIKTMIVLLIAVLIPVLLDISSKQIMKDTDYINCIEDEEIKAIEETDITPPTIVKEVKKKKETKEQKEEIIETIEVVEGEESTTEIQEEDNAFYFLNVGAGTEAFIIYDQGHFGLIDTSYDSKASFILKQLKKLGAKELDFIIITHSHLDHMGGYNKIMSKMKTKTLYIKDPGNVNSDYVPTYLEIIRKAEEKGTTICDVKDELCKNIDLGNIRIDLYNTEFYTSKGIEGLDRSRVENANSIVAVASIHKRRIYFASDIGDYETINAETNSAKEIGDIDVYKVAHHGYVSYNNNLLALSYLKPEYNIVTNTKELSSTAINRIKNTSPNYLKTYYTTNGTVTLHINEDSTFEFKQ